MNRDFFGIVLKDDLATYDPYDIWKTKIGFFVKNLFNNYPRIALVPAAILSILDLFANPVMRFIYKKQEYPIVRAQAALVLINLFKMTGSRFYLDKARLHLDWIVCNYSPGFEGFGWGINFDLPVDRNIVYGKDTPYATITPYCLEALVGFRDASKSRDYDEYILGVLTFLENSIKTMIDKDDLLATSYGPFKDRVVTNSVSYTMYSYALLIKFFPDLEGYIKNKVYRLYNFICFYQRQDGSWLYGPLDQGSFIDCFHSAFVLKNLIKTNELMALDGCDEVIFKGFNYIEENMKDKSSGLYRRFSFSNKPGLAKYDLYDNAEMMNILVLLGRQEKARELEKAIDFAFFRGEDVYSMVDIFGFKRNKNTLRWAVMPYLLSRSSFSYE